MGSDVSDDVDEDPTGNKALWDRGLLNGASQKADVIANFHVGETVSCCQLDQLINVLSFQPIHKHINCFHEF